MSTNSHGPQQRLSAPWKMASLGALAVAMATGTLLYHGHATKAAAAASSTAMPVATGMVTRRDMPVWLTGVGSVAPINVVDVKARADGQLARLFFAEGDEVKAGQLLAQIDPRPYQAALMQAQAMQAKDSAQFGNARRDATRTAALAQAGAGTMQTADAAQAQAATLKATVAADTAAVRAARLNLDFASVRAPVAGRVGLRQVTLGSMVHASDTTGLVTVTQMAPISVIFSLPQDALGQVLAGQKHGVLPVAVYARDGSGHLADGQLAFVANAVDQTNGQFQLRALFTNTKRELWPGTFVQARVLVRTDRQAMVVPDTAVQTGETGSFVYVLAADGTANPRKVTTGPSMEGFTEIASGLKVGETVVTGGQMRLSPGAKTTARPAGGAHS
ncbi:efflux RND transporter periplasmic adaptor subunit [Novosphingobium rosa]|uniref:efflux RND transporter periplasmic adaptor subunit n=1 Tax=Novosphingobium rosa TaxID=76978 RepID=UPI001FE01D2F|nr:efflux RND transporter periplasmic adaptor subunit [Novosphingobium rosa]